MQRIESWWYLILSICCISSIAMGADSAGLVAEWNFDEGSGEVAKDASGKGHDVSLHGATWAAVGDGFALSFDGMDDFIEAKIPEISGPIAMETWIKPMRKGYGMASVLGDGLSSFLLSYYNTEVIDFYIADGSNSVRGKLRLGEWNHVVASFDGTQMNMWVNGRLTGSRESKFKTYQPTGHFFVSTKGQSSLPQFKGMLDRVRVYSRGVTADEAIAHFKSEAGQYGFDPTWFSHVKVTPYFYPERGEIVVESSYRGLQPLAGEGSLDVLLVDAANPENVIHRQTVAPLPASGVAEATLPGKDLGEGKYLVRVSLRDGNKQWPAEDVDFSYPPPVPSLPAPQAKAVASFPQRQTSEPFQFKMGAAGGFTVSLNGQSYEFQSRISWPHGDFNRMTGDDQPVAGESSWKATVTSKNNTYFEVAAGGSSYTVNRVVEVFPTHVYVKDTYTNTTNEDLGLLIYNEMPVKPGQVTGSWLSGHDRWGRQAELSYPDYSPSMFMTDAHTGMAMVPMDDVYVVHAVPYVEEQSAGVCTEKFALAPGKSYTLEWAIYPTESKDYYDFVNTYRKVENRAGTLDAGFGFISFGPMNRRQVPDKDFFEKRGIKYGVISSLGRLADDPEISIEGIEFMEWPRESQLLKAQAAAFHQKHPGRKVMFHVAHSLYCTNDVEKFADSKAINADGTQAIWGASEPYISKRRQEEGWTWRIYYPTPGNSFHDALMKSVDVMMNDMGMDGVFMDGFFAAYSCLWTYDGRWDGHSAEIDPATKTIRRKMGSVLLLSQPSMIEFARKVRDKGGTIISNGTVITRSIANEKYIIFDNECASGPELHLAPTVTVLANPPFASERELYADMLDKLGWGELFAYFIERINLANPSLAARSYPMTFEEIRSGLVRGPQRIVTMNSGIYGWPGKRELHLVHKFDARGSAVAHDYVTTIDSEGVRTELNFGEHESAVIEPIPAMIQSASPVNARVASYKDGNNLSLLLSGNGDATLDLFVGTSYPDKRDGVLTDGGINPGVKGVGDPYRVTIGDQAQVIEERDGTLLVPLKLNGQTEILIQPESFTAHEEAKQP